MSIETIEAQVHHLALAVEDMERAVEFYCGHLGFEKEWEMDHRSGEAISRVVGLDQVDARMVMLKGHGLRLELFHYHRPQGKRTETRRQCDFGLTHFALSVKNIDQIYQRLNKAGVRFNCPPQDVRPGARATYLKDPEGVTIELVQYQ